MKKENNTYRLKTSVLWQGVIKINWIIFVSSWFIVGFIGMIFSHLHDMRGEEFDENYFNKECVFVSIVMFLFGFIFPIILLFIWIHKKRAITKILYKIANIGISKKQ